MWNSSPLLSSPHFWLCTTIVKPKVRPRHNCGIVHYFVTDWHWRNRQQKRGPPARVGKDSTNLQLCFFLRNAHIVKEGDCEWRKEMPNPRRDGTDLYFDTLETQRGWFLFQLLMSTVKDSILDWGVLDIQWWYLALPPQNKKAGSDIVMMEPCGDWRDSEAIGWLFLCLPTASVPSFSSKLFAYMKLLTRTPQIMPKYL